MLPVSVIYVVVRMKVLKVLVFIHPQEGGDAGQASNMSSLKTGMFLVLFQGIYYWGNMVNLSCLFFFFREQGLAHSFHCLHLGSYVRE